MNGRSRQTRVPVIVDAHELAAIDAWQLQREMPSRAAAIRHLLKRGLSSNSGSGHSSPIQDDVIAIPLMGTRWNARAR